MIQVFKYIPELDAFVCTPEFQAIVGFLGLAEWTPVVWICRYFGMDNDYAEHFFDNWDERKAIEEKAKEMGYNDYSELLIVVPERFKDGKDGPCHSNEMRKRFWTDVMKSLKLSLETIIEEARENNEKCKWAEDDTEDFIVDLEERINEMKKKHNS